MLSNASSENRQQNEQQQPQIPQHRGLTDDEIRSIFELLYNKNEDHTQNNLATITTTTSNNNIRNNNSNDSSTTNAIKFVIVPCGPNCEKLSPPSYAFPNGLYVLLQPTKIGMNKNYTTSTTTGSKQNKKTFHSNNKTNKNENERVTIDTISTQHTYKINSINTATSSDNNSYHPSITYTKLQQVPQKQHTTMKKSTLDLPIQYTPTSNSSSLLSSSTAAITATSIMTNTNDAMSNTNDTVPRHLQQYPIWTVPTTTNDDTTAINTAITTKTNATANNKAKVTATPTTTSTIYCKWRLSGPQFPSPTAIQQRYCYPIVIDQTTTAHPKKNFNNNDINDNSTSDIHKITKDTITQYCDRTGGALYTMYSATIGKELLDYRLLHVYYSSKRAGNKGINHMNGTNSSNGNISSIHLPTILHPTNGNIIPSPSFKSHALPILPRNINNINYIPKKKRKYNKVRNTNPKDPFPLLSTTGVGTTVSSKFVLPKRIKPSASEIIQPYQYNPYNHHYHSIQTSEQDHYTSNRWYTNHNTPLPPLPSPYHHYWTNHDPHPQHRRHYVDRHSNNNQNHQRRRQLVEGNNNKKKNDDGDMIDMYHLYNYINYPHVHHHDTLYGSNEQFYPYDNDINNNSRSANAENVINSNITNDTSNNKIDYNIHRCNSEGLSVYIPSSPVESLDDTVIGVTLDHAASQKSPYNQQHSHHSTVKYTNSIDHNDVHSGHYNNSNSPSPIRYPKIHNNDTTTTNTRNTTIRNISPLYSTGLIATTTLNELDQYVSSSSFQSILSSPLLSSSSSISSTASLSTLQSTKNCDAVIFNRMNDYKDDFFLNNDDILWSNSFHNYDFETMLSSNDVFMDKSNAIAFPTSVEYITNTSCNKEMALDDEITILNDDLYSIGRNDMNNISSIELSSASPPPQTTNRHMGMTTTTSSSSSSIKESKNTTDTESTIENFQHALDYINECICERIIQSNIRETKTSNGATSKGILSIGIDNEPRPIVQDKEKGVKKEDVSALPSIETSSSSSTTTTALVNVVTSWAYEIAQAPFSNQN